MRLALSANARTASLAGLLAVAMVGLGFAAVPLYNLFCRVTGFGGTTQRVDAGTAAAEPMVLTQTMSVRFDANVSPKLPWSFRPEHPRDTVSIGARDMAIYIAENHSSSPITGTASFNVTPVQAGKYFTKIQCFCFTEQRLEPGQQMRMPVLFFVDPKILDDPDARDVQEITLSYTFYPVDEGKKAS
ncbi:MAG: cytochrome c oxidase assembly protein [Sphingopyxis macrogoltabida]|uniref:Cytochrome c oxidase assembly protein CtaG n=1 Tax=Sphingopyxis macrogoltabida TaxID=33050 RepID=A0A2W5L1L8_SPHMC|nr:MAG: cytochrome c oxidase assembly protein [Sphingopyxis macrogoltabida]